MDGPRDRASANACCEKPRWTYSQMVFNWVSADDVDSQHASMYWSVECHDAVNGVTEHLTWATSWTGHCTCIYRSGWCDEAGVVVQWQTSIHNSWMPTLLLVNRCQCCRKRWHKLWLCGVRWCQAPAEDGWWEIPRCGAEEEWLHQNTTAATKGSDCLQENLLAAHNTVVQSTDSSSGQDSRFGSILPVWANILTISSLQGLPHEKGQQGSTCQRSGAECCGNRAVTDHSLCTRWRVISTQTFGEAIWLSPLIQ